MALMAGVLLLALGATLDLASVDDPKINFHDPASSTVSATIESTNSTPLTLKVASTSGATPTAAVRIAATGAVSVNTLNVDTLNVTTDVVVNGVSFNALQAQLAAVNTLLFGGPNGQAADFVVQRLVSMGVEGTPLNFSATGAAQSFTVPSGIHLYKAVLFGAAGGGGSGEGYSFAGGCGGYTVGYLPVVQGDVLSIQVGQGGDVWRNAGALARPYPSGGQPGTRVGYDVGQGGGRSAIMRGSSDQLPYSNVYALVAGGGVGRRRVGRVGGGAAGGVAGVRIGGGVAVCRTVCAGVVAAAHADERRDADEDRERRRLGQLDLGRVEGRRELIHHRGSRLVGRGGSRCRGVVCVGGIAAVVAVGGGGREVGQARQRGELLDEVFDLDG